MKKTVKLLSLILAIMVTVAVTSLCVSAETGKDDGEVDISAVYIEGDVNEDGEVDLLDLIRLKKYIAGTKSKVLVANADIDDVKGIDAGDLAALRIILLNQ